jgi:integrase
MDTFEQYYMRCRKALQRACRQIWPRRESHITLYSGRHQFCANLKAVGRSRAEVAYAMGHGSEETAAAHYGKRRSGWRGLEPMATTTPDLTMGALRQCGDAPSGRNVEAGALR